MSRSRYKFGERAYPYFITCTIVGWQSVFTPTWLRSYSIPGDFSTTESECTCWDMWSWRITCI